MHSTRKDTLTKLFQSLSLQESINLLGSWATQHQLPIALWRQPSETMKIVVSLNGIEPLNEDLDALPAGFVFASYNASKWFIKADLTLDLEQRTLAIDPTLNATDILDDLILHKPANWKHYTLTNSAQETKKEEFIQQVETCIEAINQSSLVKVVPSRLKLEQLTEKFNLTDTFLSLASAYDNAFVSLVSAPETGTWLGASPEILISQNEKAFFGTMSLAGTQYYDKKIPLNEVAWTQKEIEEQAMVSRYIINRFKEIRLREFEEIGPHTVQAGNLAHLCSTYSVDTRATNFPDLASVMLKLLHPTSAVCGMPKDLAQKQIKLSEKHDRAFYAGYLGPVNFEEKTDIYVNLRCMQLFEDQAALYAGVGVTGYSNPIAEWEETEMKCDTLLSVIQL